MTLSDGSPAEEKVREFLRNPYVTPLQPNVEVSFKSNSLRIRFDGKSLPELFARAVAAGVPKDQANKLRAKDSEILATALFYRAQRLTTYDPFLIFLGQAYLERETGLIISKPISPFLPFTDDSETI